MNSSQQHFIELLLIMAERELRARYKNTVFGFFWLVINPLIQMLVIGFIFNFFMKSPVTNYYYYLFLGLLVWNFFSSTLTRSTDSIVIERNLVKKTKFPYLVIPLSIILSNFTQMIVAFILYMIPVIFLNTLSIWSLPVTLAAFILLLALVIGISLLTSSLNVRFRDINFFVQAILIIWFYATPIIYPSNIIPNKFIWLWKLNPMVSILQLFQSGILNFPMPEPSILTINIVFIFFMLISGVFIFIRDSKYFDDWL